MTNYDDVITKLIDEGNTASSIAIYCSLDVASVNDRIKKLGLVRSSVWHRDWSECQTCDSTVYAHARDGQCGRCTGETSGVVWGGCAFCGVRHNLLVRIAQDGLRRYLVCLGCDAAVRTCSQSVASWCGMNRLRIPAEELLAIRPDRSTHVAILGGSGFVGANLTRYLLSHYQVTQSSRHCCDAMDERSVRDFMVRNNPDVVVNLAAFVGGIGLNRLNPAEMLYRNLVMGSNVLNACYQTGVRKLIYLGSVCSYPHTPPSIPFREDNLWAGRPEPTNEPYGLAKKTIGLMLDAYRRQYNYPSAYLIPTNMYGPYDDFSLEASHVIPAMIRKFITAARTGEAVTLWGDGSPSREFLYVDDCCEAIRLAITTSDEPVPINLGTGIETPMRDLAAMIAEEVGYVGEIIWDASKPNGQPRRCLDTSVASNLLNFMAKTSLRDGLRWTVRWYRDHLSETGNVV